MQPQLPSYITEQVRRELVYRPDLTEAIQSILPGAHAWDGGDRDPTKALVVYDENHKLAYPSQEGVCNAARWLKEHPKAESR